MILNWINENCFLKKTGLGKIGESSEGKFELVLKGNTASWNKTSLLTKISLVLKSYNLYALWFPA